MVISNVKYFRRRDKRLHKRSLTPLNRIIPNVVTLMSLCVGLSAIRFAFYGKWQAAVGCIIGSAILDGTDGRIARLLNSSSQFGAELDSLADCIAFGASPAVVVYLFSLCLLGTYGWAVCLFFVVCNILRLARFNIHASDNGTQYWEKKFFTGVPVPFGAIIALTPLMLNIEYGHDLFRSPYFCSAFMLFSGALMISRIKTFSFKTIKVSQKSILPVMLGAGLVVTLAVTALWPTMTVIVIMYLTTIPISMRYYKKLIAEFKESPHTDTLEEFNMK